MNRQKIRMIVLAVLLVAGGGYLWLQQSASAVKPAQTTNTAKKPLVPTASKKPTAGATTPTAAAKPGSTPTAPVNAANKVAPVPQPKTAAAAPTATPTSAKPSPAVQPLPAASTATAKPAPVPTPVAASAPTAAPASSPVPVETASWQAQLQKGAYLAEKIRPRLPEGTDLVTAAAGFRDLQQFVATVNASHNLTLSFDELKRRVVTDRKGLASAIDAMKKVSSATIEEQRAEYEARGLIQEAKRHPLPPAPAPRAVSTKEPAKKPIRTRAGV